MDREPDMNIKSGEISGRDIKIPAVRELPKNKIGTQNSYLKHHMPQSI